MCGNIDPHFWTACHWMTPFLFFSFCSHLMTPIFKMLSHWMTPIFRNKCSHWMTPGSQINARNAKWTPLSAKNALTEWLPLSELHVLTEWSPFSEKNALTECPNVQKWMLSLNEPLFPPFFYRLHQITPYFSGPLTERPLFSLYSLSPKDPYFWSRCRTSPSLPYLSASPGYSGTAAAL